MSSPIRLLLVDDHLVLRESMADLLKQRPNLEVVGQAGTGHQAVELAHILKPDVVLMDIEMPDMSGIEATRQIRALLPAMKVLILSGHDQDDYYEAASKMGANGYLVKTQSVEQVARAIESVYQGDPSHSPVRHAALEPCTRNRIHMVRESTYILTGRESEVLHLLSLGLTNRAIAKTLSISDRTVQAHLTHMFAKMHVKSRLDAVLRAIRDGLLPVSQSSAEAQHQNVKSG